MLPAHGSPLPRPALPPQFLGAIMGALLQAWMSPFSAVGHVDASCHTPLRDLGNM